MYEKELEMLEAMKETAKYKTHCDRCGELLGEKFCLRVTKVVLTAETVCEKCDKERETNVGIIQDALIEAMNKLIGD